MTSGTTGGSARWRESSGSGEEVRGESAPVQARADGSEDAGDGRLRGEGTDFHFPLTRLMYAFAHVEAV